MFKKIIILTLFCAAAVNVSCASAAEDQFQEFTINAHVKEKFNLSCWVKKMENGAQDPGKEGLKHINADGTVNTDLNFGDLIWEDGRCKPENKTWFAIFFGLDSNIEGGFRLQVTAEDITYNNRSIGSGFILTPDWNILDKWMDHDSNGEEVYYEQKGPISGVTEKIHRFDTYENADSPGKINFSEVRTVNSVATGRSMELYSATGPSNRIVRCYVSVLDYRDFNHDGSVDDKDTRVMSKLMSTTGAQLITEAVEGYYKGRLVFTMTTA